MRPHNLSHSISGQCKNTPLYDATKAGQVWSKTILGAIKGERLVSLTVVLGDEWKGWEAVETALNCTELMNTKEGPGNYTLHLYLYGPKARCGNAFLFVSIQSVLVCDDM